MRNLSIFLVGALVSIGLAGSASALSITDVPQEFSGHRTAGTITYGLESDSVLTMKIAVNYGKVARARIAVTSAGGDIRQPVAHGSVVGPGVNIGRVRVRGDGQVDFFFHQSFFRWYIGKGQESDTFFVVYDDLAAGDLVSMTGYRHWIFGSFGTIQTPIVPEPSTAVLVGLGLVGLAVAGRRR